MNAPAALIASIRNASNPGPVLYAAGVEMGSVPVAPHVHRLTARGTGAKLGYLVDCGDAAQAHWCHAASLAAARRARAIV